MQTIKVKTAQNVDIDYEVAGVGERTLARLIDFGFFLALYLIALIVYFLIQKPVGARLAGEVIGIVYAALFVFYDLACETLMNGQSFGKRIMKIKVISLDGGRPRFSQYLLRWLFRLIDFTISFQLCGLLTAAITQKQQRLGDIVAGTTLIKTSPRTKARNLVFKPVENTYQPIFANLNALNDNDITLLQEVIRTYHQTGNQNIVIGAASRVRDLLSVNSPENMNDLKFLQTIIKDYNYNAAATDQLTNN
jgi:uncharacterized RDD family membrane protein YckC